MKLHKIATTIILSTFGLAFNPFCAEAFTLTRLSSDREMNALMKDIAFVAEGRIGDRSGTATHELNLHESASSRAQEQGYPSSLVAENIGAGYTTPEEVVQGWINSQGHRANLLNPDYTEIGIGYFYLANDTGVENWNHYWTQVFGR